MTDQDHLLTDRILMTGRVDSGEFVVTKGEDGWVTFTHWRGTESRTVRFGPDQVAELRDFLAEVIGDE